jgi:cytoskeletal protein RodZ
MNNEKLAQDNKTNKKDLMKLIATYVFIIIVAIAAILMAVDILAPEQDPANTQTNTTETATQPTEEDNPPQATSPLYVDPNEEREPAPFV